MASLLSSASATSTCLYCIFEDDQAGFLASYSYCLATDTCLEDQWNYIDYKCSSSWARGDTLNITVCSPTEVTCPSYTSSETAFGIYTNTTQVLAANTYCTVTIDSTTAVSRVIFDNTVSLGITELDYYTFGTPITIN